MTTETLVVVTREEFFAAIGTMDVHPQSLPECSMWETPGRRLVGKTTPGYRNGWTPEGKAPDIYMLVKSP